MTTHTINFDFATEFECLASLTPRELEVFTLSGDGRNNIDEMARQLGLSPKTVTEHLANIKRKTGLVSITHVRTRAAQYRLMKRLLGVRLVEGVLSRRLVTSFEGE